LTDIGTVLGGRYRLVELLGQGGMATIYRARDNQLQRDVAIKILRPEYGTDPDFIERFRHEAQSAASLNHPNVVGVYDFGTDPVGPFIVMELVEGEDLASIVRKTGALPARATARLVAQAARAVAAAHDRGFVHRDIKPGNILVTREGRVKVADFGIARALSESSLTLPGTTLGSVHYFSPEQARGELASPASDIYSLGIVLFELLTGRRPWTGDTAAAIATARLTGAVPSPSAVHSGIPPALEAITRKALATNPEDRFGSASEMAAALDQAIGEDRGAGAASAAGAGIAAGAAAPAAAGAGTAAAEAVTGAAGAAAAGGLAGAGAAGAAAAGAVGAGAPTVAGVARANPEARIAYPREAYADAASSGPAQRRTVEEQVDDVDDEEVEHRATSPWLWITAILAIVILALAGFLLTRFLGGPGESPGPQVTVPNLVGLTFDQARAAAEDVGLQVSQVAFEQASGVVGTVLRQDPPFGGTADAGSTIELTMVKSADLTVVPDLRLRTESEALNILFDASLRPGVRTDAFDAIVPLGAIVSQEPFAGQAVAPQTPINYVVSKGPEPTPSPSPTPQPTPTPPPPPPPTQPPPPPPTPTPTPPPITVGEYRCVLLAIAAFQIEADGFQVGNISGPNDPDAEVVAQDPAPGEVRPPGSQIDLTTEAQPVATCPTDG
jgi:eukaryotic-like serine/threonine-protein kinase